MPQFQPETLDLEKRAYVEYHLDQLASLHAGNELQADAKLADGYTYLSKAGDVWVIRAGADPFTFLVACIPLVETPGYVAQADLAHDPIGDLLARAAELRGLTTDPEKLKQLDIASGVLTGLAGTTPAEG